MDSKWETESKKTPESDHMDIDQYQVNKHWHTNESPI